MGDAAFSERGAAGPVGHDDRVLRPCYLHIVKRNRLHQHCGIDALLIARPDEVVERQARQRHHWRAIHMRVVEPVEEMDCARSCGPDAHSKPPRMLGETGGHEGRRLLVTHADILDPIASLAQRFDD